MATKKDNKTEVKIVEELKPEFTQYYDKEDAYKNLDRVIGWVNNCDTKTSILIAFVAAIIALFAKTIASSFKFLVSFCDMQSKSSWDIAKFVLIIMLFISLVFFLFIVNKSVFSALIAKIDYKKYKQEHFSVEEQKKLNKGKSILFFESIADCSLEEFKSKEKQISEEEFFDDISTQIYFNAKRCTEKLRNYNIAFKASIFLFVNVIALMIISFL